MLDRIVAAAGIGLFLVGYLLWMIAYSQPAACQPGYVAVKTFTDQPLCWRE